MTKYINKGGKAYKLGMEKPGNLTMNDRALFNMAKHISEWNKHLASLTDGIEISPELLRDWPEWGIKGEGEFLKELRCKTWPNCTCARAHGSTSKCCDPIIIAVPVEPKDPFIEKHLSAINKKMDEARHKLISDRVKHLPHGLFRSSVQHFLDTGSVSGSFYDALLSIYNLKTEEPKQETFEERRNRLLSGIANESQKDGLYENKEERRDFGEDDMIGFAYWVYRHCDYVCKDSGPEDVFGWETDTKDGFFSNHELLTEYLNQKR